MKPALRNLVRQRAGDRCEYCRLAQEFDPLFVFHIEHIIARQHLGQSDEANLALSCHLCNSHKGPNLAGLDPLTGLLAALFHPRTQSWNEHFTFDGPVIVGLTPTGRATAHVLNMNASDRIDVRLQMIAEGKL